MGDAGQLLAGATLATLVDATAYDSITAALNDALHHVYNERGAGAK